MKVNPGYLLLSVFLLLFCKSPVAQITTDPQELFSEGEFFYLADEFEEALYYYLQLVDIYPDNANYNFKVGDTYLNIPGQEYKSIPYLEKATTATSIKYKRRSFKEKNAPHYSIFSLGNAYRINNEVEKALETYQKFTDSKDFEDNYNIGMVEDEIRACQRSKMIQDVPIDVKLTKFGSPINRNSDNTNAILSGDGTIMIFVTELAFYDAIHLSRKVNGAWTEPEVLNPQVGSDGDMYPTSLSYDGKELFMVKRTEGNNDIYVSTLGTDFWSKARALGPNINTGTDETHASITADGNTLYFSSAKRGGYGGLDIYRSERLASGEWGEAQNLGPVINSDEDEDTPFPSDNGKRLYFSSTGHFNMGGFDVFYSNLSEDESWRDPINIGFPINTTTDDQFFYPIGDGSQGYMSKIERDGIHAFNIYHLAIGDRVKEFTENQTRFREDFTIRLVNPETGDTIIIHYLKEKDIFKTEDPSYKLNIEEK